ncbi:hypothetical protein BH23GEM7_BH23GEM7_19700 [soil metagenome]
MGVVVLPGSAQATHSDGRQGPTRKGVVVGCGEPPAGSSVTALRSRASPGGTERVMVARPSGSVSKVPRLTGASLSAIP